VSNGPWPAASFHAGHYDQFPVIELLRAAARGWVGVDRRLLKSILDRGDAAAPEVLAFSREPRQGQRLDLDSVLIHLFRHYQTPEAAGFLVDAIRRNPEEVPDVLVETLLPLGDKAVEPLLALYEELGEERGGEVAFVLAGLRVRDPRVLALLCERLQFDAMDGAFFLGLYGDPAARGALEEMLAEIPESEDAELRREFSHALELLDAPEPRYDPDPFDILAEYPARELPEFDVLPEGERLEMLASPDPEIRGGAAYSFFNAELSPAARTALLNAAKTDADATVRGFAWASLADAVQDSGVREAMIAVLSDRARDVEERGGAAIGLYGAAERPEVRGLLEALYEEGGLARAKALEAMWRSIYKPYAKYFAPHLDDRDPEILRQALRGAGYFHLSSYADKIASYFSDEDLREDALFAYALAMPGETTRGRARGMLRKIESLTHLLPEETRLAMFGIDERLRLHGLAPVFEPLSEDQKAEPAVDEKVGRNDPCPCGSGKKYKKCHGK